MKLYEKMTTSKKYKVAEEIIKEYGENCSPSFYIRKGYLAGLEDGKNKLEILKEFNGDTQK